MKKLRIAERWDMTIDWKPGDTEWYGFWAHEQPSHMSKPVTSSWMMLSSLAEYNPNISSVLELAAGCGFQSLMINELFPIVKNWNGMHLIQDLHEESIAHIEGLILLGHLGDNVELRVMDAYDSTALVRADLIAIDMGDLSARQLVPGKPQYELLDRAFKLSPAAVTVADIAGIRLGLHRHLQEEVLGEGSCPDYSTYLLGMVQRIEELWGYRALEVFHTKQFAKMALVPATEGLITKYTPVGDEPKGITVI